MAVEIHLLDAGVEFLGESPLWDHRSKQLWWIDGYKGSIFTSDAEGRNRREYPLGQSIGSIGLAKDGLLVAMGDGFHLFQPETGAISLFAKPDLAANSRLNDGKMDRAGRYLCASMRVGDEGQSGRLFRLDQDQSTHILASEVAIGNAISFSPDGRTLYFADSMDGMLRRYAYDLETGEIGPRQDLVDCRTYGSGADGATVDAQGRIWVALVLAQAVACFKPDGVLEQLIPLPLPFPSCPAFGGPDMDILYVTSIANSGHRLVADHRDAGRITMIKGLDATGIKEGVFGAGLSAKS